MRKPQATSHKQQATSDLRLSPQAIKIHEAWCMENGYLKPEASSVKHQAPRYKLQAAQKFCNVFKSLMHWFMLQASGYKLPDFFSLIKFWNVKRGIQNQDKCVEWMAYMKANLV